MNHKRNRPKHQRAGCLMCKPHKDERLPKSKNRLASERRKLQPEGGNCTFEEAGKAYDLDDFIDDRLVWDLDERPACWKPGPNYQFPNLEGHCRLPEGHEGDCVFV
jgi:hypothetical protein